MGWIRSRRKLLKQIKNQVASHINIHEEELCHYTEAYQNEFMGSWQPTDIPDLIETVENSEIILGADFHAFHQAQRTHLRVLRSLSPDKKICLALECVESCFQEKIDAYLSGKLPENLFLAGVMWNENWGFPWEYYKPIFQLAKKRGFKIFGINKYLPERSKKSLEERDLHAAERIHKIKTNYPNEIIYVIYGDLHLAREHLPQKITALCQCKDKMTVIFQNSERLYFRLIKKKLENEVEILKAEGKRFCIIGSPPWVKWQSYLIFLEQSLEADNYFEDADDIDEVDYTDYIKHYITFLRKELRVQVRGDDYSVYSLREEGINSIVDDLLTEPERKIANFLIDNDKSFFLIQDQILYLSRATTNHSASLAGYYLHAKLSKRHRNLWEMPGDFHRLIWVEAVAFYMSKLVNHKRKPDRVEDLKRQLLAGDPRSKGRESLLLVLDQRVNEMVFLHSGNLKRNKFKAKSATHYVLAAKFLGSMMGERLYQYLKLNKEKKEILTELLSKEVEDNDFDIFYFSIVKQLEKYDVNVSLWGAE